MMIIYYQIDKSEDRRWLSNRYDCNDDCSIIMHIKENQTLHQTWEHLSIYWS